MQNMGIIYGFAENHYAVLATLYLFGSRKMVFEFDSLQLYFEL